MTFGLPDVIAGLAIARELALVVIASRATRALSKASGTRAVRMRGRVFIIIPVFREVELVAECCRFFEDLARRDGNARVLICGTIRERVDGVNATMDLAAESLRDPGISTAVECPTLYGSKADQINFALSIIDVIHENDLVGIYDIDSRPDYNTLSNLRQYANDEVDIIQQHAVFLGNIKDIRGNFILLGQALYQCRWTLLHECGRFYLYSKGFIPAVHLVGHGLFVRVRVLRKYGGIPTETDIEDAHLGFYASVDNLTIRSLPLFDISDSPNNFRDSFWQIYGWSKGPREASRYAKYYVDKIKNVPTNWARLWYVQMATLATWGRWAITSVVCIVLLTFAVCGNLLAWTWILLYGAHLGVILRRQQKISGQGTPNPLIATAAVLSWLTIGSAPVLLSWFDSLANIRRVKYKTTHR